jgi:DNA-binding NarL/FixJ family response regulator
MAVMSEAAIEVRGLSKAYGDVQAVDAVSFTVGTGEVFSLIEMPGLDGIAAAGELARELPATRVLILTTFGRPGYLRRAMEQGAAGFLLKDAPAEELARAIRRVLRGSASSIRVWRRPR